MFNSTLELINLAASNSLLVFCFCNLIIVILLVGNSKSTSNFDEDEKNIIIVQSREAHSSSKSTSNFDKEKTLSAPEIVNRNKKSVTVQSRETRFSFDSNNEMRSVEAPILNRKLVIDDDQEEERTQEDDELRRRIEEFINKTNRGWKAEKLQTTSLLVQ